MNYFEEFVYKYRDKDWDWGELGSNKLVTWNLIHRLRHKPWSKVKLCKNENTTLVKFIQNRKEWKLKWTDFSRHNPNMYKDFLEHFEYLSVYSFILNPVCPIELVLSHVDRNTSLEDWGKIMSNKHMTIDIVHKYRTTKW